MAQDPSQDLIQSFRSKYDAGNMSDQDIGAKLADPTKFRQVFDSEHVSDDKIKSTFSKYSNPAPQPPQGLLDRVKAWADKPGYTPPNITSEHHPIIAGVANEAMKLAYGLATPKNAVIGAVMAAQPELIPAISAYFMAEGALGAAQGISNVYNKYQQTGNVDWEGVKGVGENLLTVGLGAEGKRPVAKTVAEAQGLLPTLRGPLPPVKGGEAPTAAPTPVSVPVAKPGELETSLAEGKAPVQGGAALGSSFPGMPYSADEIYGPQPGAPAGPLNLTPGQVIDSSGGLGRATFPQQGEFRFGNMGPEIPQGGNAAAPPFLDNPPEGPEIRATGAAAPPGRSMMPPLAGQPTEVETPANVAPPTGVAAPAPNTNIADKLTLLDNARALGAQAILPQDKFAAAKMLRDRTADLRKAIQQSKPSDIPGHIEQVSQLGHMPDAAGTIEALKYQADKLRGQRGAVSGEMMYGDLPDKVKKFGTYFSTLYQNIREKMPNSMQPEQLAGMLRNTKGVSPDEVRWTGLANFLSDKKAAGESVSKSEAMKYLEENAIKVNEVQKAVPTSEEVARYQDLTNRFTAHTPAERAEYDTLGDKIRYEKGTPKFAQYTLPGGTNYREVLGTFLGKLGSLKFFDLHWKEPNPLFHIRMDDRIGPSGEKILHVHNIQSAWADASREKPPTSEKIAELEALRAEEDKNFEERTTLDSRNPIDRARMAELVERGDQIGTRYNEPDMQAVIRWKGQPSTPDAPLLNSWHELALKNVLRKAASEGYDRVSWSPSDVVNKVEFMPIEKAKTLYDQMIPSFMSKFGKQWGAKVEDTSLLVPQEGAFKIDQTEKNAPPISQSVQSLPITPSMRDSISREGFPLFGGTRSDIPRRSELGSISGDMLFGNTPEHLINFANKVSSAAGKLSDGIKSYINDYKLSYDERSSILKHLIGPGKEAYDLVTGQTQKVSDQYKNDNKAQLLQKTDALESGGPIKDPSFAGAYKLTDNLIGEQRTRFEALDPSVQNTWFDNYFGRFWKNPERAQTIAQTLNSKRPIEGSGGFLKKRSDLTTREMVEAGAEPMSYNFVDHQISKYMEMERYLNSINLIKQDAAAGRIKWFDHDEMPPKDYVRGREPIFQNRLGAPEDAKLGSYYMPKAVEKAYNNFLSQGISGPAVTAFRNFGSAQVALRLGLSGYHGIQSALISSAINFGRSIQTLTSSDALSMENFGTKQWPLAQAAANFARGAIFRDVQTAAADAFTKTLSDLGLNITPTQYSLGSKLMAQRAGAGTFPEMNKYSQAMSEGGSGIHQNAPYLDEPLKQFRRARADGDVAGMTKWALLHAISLPARPLMREFIPRIKATAAVLQISDILRQMPEDSPARQDRIVRVMDSNDNLFGQMQHDRNFWDKAYKDIFAVTYQAPGWNIGNVKQIAGASREILETPQRLQERGQLLGDKMATIAGYTAATAWSGYLLNWLINGKAPQNIKDTFFVPTGVIGSNGKPERIPIGGYNKDAVNALHDWKGTVAGKIHPTIQALWEAWKNEDYFGQEISSEDDSAPTALGKDALHVLAGATPISVEQMMKERQEGAGIGQQLKSFAFGSAAPKWLSQSDAEQELDFQLKREQARGPRRKEEVAKEHYRGQLIGGLRSGKLDISNIVDELDKGKISGKDYKSIVEDARKSPLQAGVRRLNDLPSFMSVWRKASPDEKSQLEPYAIQKLSNAVKNSSEDDRDSNTKLLQEILDGVKPSE